MVPKERLELSRTSHRGLNPARLPIPPLRHMAVPMGFEPMISAVTGQCFEPLSYGTVERPKGFEPLYSGWKPEVLPLNDGRDVSLTNKQTNEEWLAASDSNRASRAYQARAFPTKLAANEFPL